MTSTSPDARNFGTLHWWASPDPKQVAIIDATREESVTYSELEERVARAAGVLREFGVVKGDRVGCCFTNETRFITLLLAVARIGAVAVPVAADATTNTLSYILEDAGAKIVLIAGKQSLQDTLSKAIEENDTVEQVGVDTTEPKSMFSPTSVFSIPTQMHLASSVDEPVSITPSDPALQPYTSGSTGKPKGVVLTHRGITWCTDAFRRHLSLSSNDCGLVVTPLHHKNAMVGVIKPMLASGGRVVIHESFEVDTTLESIDSQTVTYMTGVPVVYKRLINDASGLESHDLSSFSWASCGSQAVPTDLVDTFENIFDACLLEVYGLTEGGPLVTHSRRDRQRKVGSAGTPLPGVSTLIVDTESREILSPRQEGELLVASPGTARYFDRPTATEATYEERNGLQYLQTGDRAFIDADGYHYIVGRLDDMLLVGGENVYPATVAGILQQHDAVQDAAVVGVPHAEKGEAPVGYVVTTNTITESDLQSFARKTGPSHAYPRRIFFQKALPLTGNGKTDYSRLRRDALKRIDTPL